MPDSLGVGVKVVRTARVPMGGWAEETPSALRHHETLPEESSEDEMPPHVHRVKPLYGKAEFWLKIWKFAALKSFLFPLLSFRCHNKAMVNQGLNHAFGSLTAHLHAFGWLCPGLTVDEDGHVQKEASRKSSVQNTTHVSKKHFNIYRNN